MSFQNYLLNLVSIIGSFSISTKIVPSTRSLSHSGDNEVLLYVTIITTFYLSS